MLTLCGITIDRLSFAVLVSIANILHLAITIFGAASPIAVATVIVAFTAVVFAGRELSFTAVAIIAVAAVVVSVSRGVVASGCG